MLHTIVVDNFFENVLKLDFIKSKHLPFGRFLSFGD